MAESEAATKRRVNHQKTMQLLAAMVVEHGLRFLPPQDETRKTIEEDIAIVRSHNQRAMEARYRIAKKRKISYTPAGQLLYAAGKMLYAAKHRAPSAMLIDPCITAYTAEAGYLVSEQEIWRTQDWSQSGGQLKEQRAEYDWQEKRVWPLLRKIYEDYGGEFDLAEFSND